MRKKEEERGIGSVTFHERLDRLRRKVLNMASLAQHNVERAIYGLLNREAGECESAISRDREINQMEKDIDHEGVQILGLFNPRGIELRQVLASMKISNNLERISDEAVNIARRALSVLGEQEFPEVRLVEPVFTLAQDMMLASFRAFAEHDLQAARAMDQRDDALDKAHLILLKQLRKRLEVGPARVKPYLDLMFVVRSLERIGDHATNIAEETVFIESAEDVRHKR